MYGAAENGAERGKPGALPAANGSGTGEMEAGLQMETGAAEPGVPAGPGCVGLYGPAPPASFGASRGGVGFFLAGRALGCPLLCCCCWRHLARRFLEHHPQYHAKLLREIAKILKETRLRCEFIYYTGDG